MFDLIPKTCWFKNVRHCVHSSEWNRLRDFVYNRVDYTCECCGIKTNDIEAHERWDYNNDSKIQKLVRLVALCNMFSETTRSITSRAIAEVVRIGAVEAVTSTMGAPAGIGAAVGAAAPRVMAGAQAAIAAARGCRNSRRVVPRPGNSRNV